MAISDTYARVISDVYTGKLHPRIATGLACSSECSRKRRSRSAWEESNG